MRRADFRRRDGADRAACPQRRVPALLLGGAIGLAAPKRLSKAPGRAFCVVLAVSLLVCSALLLAAGATLAQQTLLPNGRLLTCLMLTLSFALLCALSSGTGVCRVAFALRWLLPAALAVFAGLSLSSCSMAGLFPLLGAGIRSLGLSALLSLSACSPALMLFLPPQELETPAPVPKGGFFALRVGLGGLLGALMLAALALCNPYEIIQGQHVWGARMLILASARPREGLVQTLLILAQLFSMLIGAVSTLCAAAQALETAFPKLRFFSLWLCAALLLGALMATAFFGMDVLLAVSPFLLIPEGILIGISFFKKAPS